MRWSLPVAVLIVLILSGCASPATLPSATSTTTTPPATTTATAPTAAFPATATTTATPSPEPQGTLRGVALSPRTFETADYIDFLERAAAGLDLVAWAGDWLEITRDDGGPVFIETAAAQFGFIPLAELSVHHDGELLRPFDAANKKLFVDSAVAYVTKYRPRFLGLGIEVNTLWENHPDDFGAFVDTFNEAAAAVRAASSDTLVFTVFQLEKLLGYTLWLNEPPDPEKAEWDLVARFDADFIAFTTYPDLVFKDPSEIPDDYYAAILDHVDTPIAFTEIGWHAAASPTGWESSGDEQGRFLEKFITLIEPFECPLLIWSFFYDPDTFEPFDTMGLYGSDGSARPAAGLWLRP